MKFSIQDFVAIPADNGRPNSERSELVHVQHIHIEQIDTDQFPTTRCVTPPSPLFTGINHDDIDSEPFPDLIDLSEPGSFEPAFEHCIVHCHHTTCLELKCQEMNEHNYIVQECRCAIEPKTPAAIQPGPPLQLTDEILQHVAQACRGFNLNMSITIHEVDTQNFLNQFKARFEHHPIFMQLAKEIRHHLPGHRAVLATGKAYVLFFQDVEKFFSRVIALHGGDSHTWTVSIGELHNKWRNCMYTTMTDFIEEHLPKMLKHKMRPPAIIKDYISEGVPKFVWDFWNTIWEELVQVLEWREGQLAQIAAYSAKPLVFMGWKVSS